MSAFSAIEPSAAVSQGKLTSSLIALLVITECSWSSAVSGPARYFKLTSVLSANSQVTQHSAEDQLKVPLSAAGALSETEKYCLVV